MIHGWLCNGRFWEDFLDFSDKGYYLIIPDLRGHGRNAYFKDVSAQTMATDIKKLLDKLNISKAIIIGHSMGGLVTMAFYEQFPEYISAMGLWNTGGRIPFGYGIGTSFYVFRIISYVLGLILSYPISPLFRALLAGGWRLAFAMNNSGKSAYKRYVPDVVAMAKKPRGKSSVLKAAFSLAGFNMLNRLNSIKVKTSLLHGCKDRFITPIQLAKRLHKDLPDNIIHYSPKTGHFSPNEAPDEIKEYLAEFMEAV